VRGSYDILAAIKHSNLSVTLAANRSGSLELHMGIRFSDSINAVWSIGLTKLTVLP